MMTHLLIFLVLSLFSSALSSSDLHGQRVYLRAWSQEDALSFAGDADSETLEQRELDDGTPPLLMPLTIHSGEGRHMHGLLLERNERIEHPVDITYGQQREHAPLLAKGQAQYQDAMSNAIFGVKNVKGVRQYDGSFHFEGEHYEIHPMAEDDGVRARGFEEHHPHMITRAKVHDYSNDLKTIETFEGRQEIENSTLFEGRQEVENSTRQERGSATYDIELAIVVDYSEFLRWKKEAGSRTKAIEAIKYKFSYTYNGMDRVYKTVRGITTRVWLKRLEIQTEQRQSAVSELYGSKLDPSSGRLTTVDGNGILDHERKWGPKNGFAVPKNYDHVMYWLGYQMQSGGSSATIGLAYVGGVCGSSGYSLIEDTGFESWRTAAHELGHNLGSHHDAAQSGDCAYGKHHIMSATEGMPDAAHNTDGWSFSTCSITAFKNTLASKTCLGNKVDRQYGNFPVKTLPGQKFNANWQCQWNNPQLQGTGHCFGGTTRDSECYKGLFCTTARRGSCSASSALRPADGTPCNSGKCMGGRCV